MSIDEPTLKERPFTDTHDRILHALVERVHDMSIRLAALEATATPLAPPAVPNADQSHAGNASTRPSWQSKTSKSTGWQPARR